MLDEERLKIIQQMKDRAYSIYDGFRFDSTPKDGRDTNESFIKLRELMSMLDELTKDYVDTMPSFFKIVATEDTIIRNEETVEVKTNATGLTINPGEIEILFDGSIPSAGYLEMTTAFDLNGLKFYAKNNVPTKVWDDHDLCGYHYCSPTTTRYFSPGVYQIEKGQVIGVGIKNQEKKYTLFEIAQMCGLSYEEAVSEVCESNIQWSRSDFHENPNIKLTLSQWQYMSVDGSNYETSRITKFIPVTEKKNESKGIVLTKEN